MVEPGRSSPAFVVAPLALVAFVVVERRVAHPLLPLAYLRRRNFSFAIATQFFTNFAYMGGFVITPLLPRSRCSATARPASAALLIARPLAFAIAGPLAGYVAVRVGERPSAVVGARVRGGVDGRARRPSRPARRDLVIIGALALSGVGLGCSSPALAASIANAVDERDLGVAGASQQMMTQLGVVLGIQVMQTVQVVRERRRSARWRPTARPTSSAAVVAAVGVVCAAVRAVDPRRAEGAPQGALAREPEAALATSAASLSRR